MKRVVRVTTALSVISGAILALAGVGEGRGREVAARIGDGPDGPHTHTQPAAEPLRFVQLAAVSGRAPLEGVGVSISAGVGMLTDAVAA